MISASIGTQGQIFLVVGPPLTDSITESKNEEFDDDYSHSMLHFVHTQLNTWDGLNNIVFVHTSSQL